jgi:dihydrofolate reductase
MAIRICPIAAVAENGVIGNDNKLPWRIKSEWQYFIRMTKHKPVIMGRKTFESLGAPLKERANIIVTRDPSYRREGIIVATTPERAIGIARRIAEETGQDEIMIGGGAEIYERMLPLSDRLYLTEVHLKPEGDTKFPDFDRNEWLETKREFHKAKAGETADYTIMVLDRKKPFISVR